MLRHIAWFNEAPVAPCPEGGLTSTDKNVGRRCLAPARAIERLGVGCSVFGNLHDADPVHVSQHLQKLNADIVVIGAIEGRERLRLARAAKHLGCYVVADFSGEEKDEDALHQLMQVADQAVAATPELAKVIEKKIGIAAIVIPDCEEKSKGAHSPDAIAQLWVECFKRLKLKPSAGANTNVPENN
jgi:hypothetical protein